MGFDYYIFINDLYDPLRTSQLFCTMFYIFTFMCLSWGWDDVAAFLFCLKHQPVPIRQFGREMIWLLHWFGHNLNIKLCPKWSVLLDSKLKGGIFLAVLYQCCISLVKTWTLNSVDLVSTCRKKLKGVIFFERFFLSMLHWFDHNLNVEWRPSPGPVLSCSYITQIGF